MTVVPQPRAEVGGRVAEQLVLEDISTGASSDLQRATDTARAMVTRYGFSERMGPVVYGSDPGETFLGRDFGQGKGYSEAIASEIDNEIRDIVDEAYETARSWRRSVFCGKPQGCGQAADP